MTFMQFITKIPGLRLPSQSGRETEFFPAALEIVETPASPAGRAVAGVIILFFVLLLMWACLGTVDIIATAQGKIIPTERTKTIQPFETGVVRAIHVRDGQQVKAGEVLIEIDPTINEAERDRLEQELMQEKLKVARLRTLTSMKDDIDAALVIPEGASVDEAVMQRKMLANQIEEMRARLSSLDKQIAQTEGNLAAVNSTITKINEALPLLRKRYEMRRELAAKGYSSRLDALAVQQELVEHQHELEVQSGRLAEAASGVAALREQRSQVEAEYRHKNLDDLAQAELKAKNLQEHLVQAAQKFRLQTLTAPVAGTVQQLAVHTEGGVVTPAQALLIIVPAGSKLEIEAMISNRDIGFVHEGQDAAIKVDTFNFTKYGLLSGRVESVAQDAIQRTEPNKVAAKQQGSENATSEPVGQELVYMARIVLATTQMQIDDRLVTLAPGMAVTVEIKTGTRRIIEYLLSPLQRHQQQALRER